MVDPATLVGVGAVIGALARYGTNRALEPRLEGHAFPAGTLAVNVVGSFVLALVTFLGAGETVLYAVGVGACGSYTTFSSFSVDTVQLWENDYELLATGYAAVNLVGALAAIGLAWFLVTL